MSTTDKIAAPEVPTDPTELLDKITGSEGIGAVESDLQKMIQSRMQAIAIHQGEIAGYKKSLMLIEAMKRHYGLKPVDAPAPEVPEGAVEEPEGPSEEVKERLAKGLCTYKQFSASGNHKWCERKLRTKQEKANGYCKTHMNAMVAEEANAEN